MRDTKMDKQDDLAKFEQSNQINMKNQKWATAQTSGQIQWKIQQFKMHAYPRGREVSTESLNRQGAGGRTGNFEKKTITNKSSFSVFIFCKRMNMS